MYSSSKYPSSSSSSSPPPQLSRESSSRMSGIAILLCVVGCGAVVGGGRAGACAGGLRPDGADGRLHIRGEQPAVGEDPAGAALAPADVAAGVLAPAVAGAERLGQLQVPLGRLVAGRVAGLGACPGGADDLDDVVG